MLQKSIILVFILLMIVGCGKTNNTATNNSIKTEPKQANRYEQMIEAKKLEGNLLKDEGALTKIINEFKSREKFKGEKIMVFSYIRVSSEETQNHIELKILKPGTKEDIDHYSYTIGRWSAPIPVQITGKGKVSDHLVPLDSVDFSKIHIMYRNLEKKASSLENAKIENFCSFQHSQNGWRATMSIRTPRNVYYADFDLNGNLIHFRKS